MVSGSDWGNLLLWEGNMVKVEICRKGGRNCHAGIVQPFALEDGQLMTMGSDGAVRVRHLTLTRDNNMTSITWTLFSKMYFTCNLKLFVLVMSLFEMATGFNLKRFYVDLFVISFK